LSNDPREPDMVEVPLSRLQELRDKEKALEHMRHEETLVDSTVAMAHVVAEAIREVAAEAHQHHWDILGIWKPGGQPVHPRLLTSQIITVVLVRCQKCNLPQTIELAGIWTIEQIRDQAKTAADIWAEEH
jgi:hypothetical protein